MRKIPSTTPFLIVLVLLWGLTAHSLATAQDKQTFRIGGAGLLSDVVQTYGELFEKGAPQCAATITGATTGVGFQRLFDGEEEIAMVTREITPDETKKAEAKGASLGSKYIGRIGLGIITNDKNPINELTMEQLAKIFQGEITSWDQVGGPNEPIRVTIRGVPETGAGVLFQQVVLKGALYAKDAVVMSSYNITVKVCAKSLAIGYIPTTTTYFHNLGERGVKLINIKQDANSAPYKLLGGVAKESSYPISVPFLMYWNSKLENQCVKSFVDFSEKQAR